MPMESHQHFPLTLLCSFLFLLLLLSGGIGVDASHHHHRHLFPFRPSKLFVFGDSYADTGNIRKSIGNSWNIPYGITFPGKPAGRFSDGRVLTDYLARFIEVKSPVAYLWRNIVGAKKLKYGMNFAYGGTGVFDTLAPEPNMTTQIDFFQQMINDKNYTTLDMQSSVALVSLAGNDYSTYLFLNGSAQGLQDFITQVVNQLAINLKRINSLGVKKLAVTALQPLGCLPSSTRATSFQQCNATQNLLVGFHNALLQQVVAKLNNETKDSTFVVLDLYGAFMTVFKTKGAIPGSSQFENPLKPCCVGVSTTYSCGDIDANGIKKYTVCENPESAFFWDGVHPTQKGWEAVYLALQANLEQL